jgi:1,4-alpha-glucan branching enzyme
MIAVDRGSEPLAIPHQFVFESPSAHRVSVVGDFNGWDASKTPLVHTPGGTSWSVIVPIIPGRHIYGFMVDDSVFTLDPRAPMSRDVDLGTEGSVVIVGRP